MAGCSAKQGDLASLATGDMAKLSVDKDPAPAPTTAFADAAGAQHTLADFKGKAVVVNIWGTFCAPCVAEMPTLAKLQTDYAGKPLQVVELSVDTPEDKASALAFLARRPPLAFYGDPKYALAFALKPPIDGLPTTLLIDPQGRVRARLAGGADWSSPQAHKVIDALLAS